MNRIIAICGLVIGFGVIGYAVLIFTTDTAQAPKVEPAAIVVEGADIGEIPIGGMVPVHIRIHNNSNVAIRFIGGPNGCQPGGCMNTTGTCPLTIEANSVAEIPLDVRASILGSFQLEVCVYLEVAGAAVYRTVNLTGYAVPAAENEAVFAKP